MYIEVCFDFTVLPFIFSQSVFEVQKMNANFFRLEQAVVILLTYLLIWGILIGHATSLSSIVDPLSEFDSLLKKVYVNATGIKKIEKIQIKFLQNWFRILINTSLFPIFEQVLAALFFFIFWGILITIFHLQLNGILCIVPMPHKTRAFSLDIFDNPQYLKHLIIYWIFILFKDDIIKQLPLIPFIFFNQFWNILRII